MRLIDLLSVISEDTWVNIWRDGEIIEMYDGKNSIDTELNECEVLQVRGGTCAKRINIEI